MATLALFICVMFPDSAYTVARTRTGSPIAYSCTRSVVRDDLGVSHVAFSYNDGLPFAESAEVFYTRSTDEGASWSAWENVSRSDSFTVFFPSLAVDSSGAVHSTWLQFWIDSAAGWHYDCFYARRDTGVGHGWSTPRNLSGMGPNTNNFLISAVAADVRGRVHVVYQGDYNPSRVDGAIYHCVFQGDSWTRPYCLTPSPRWENETPSIACDRQGRLHAAWHLWQYSTNQDTIYYAVFDTSWGATEVIAAGAGYGEPCIAVDSQGTPQASFVAGSLHTNNETYHARRDSTGWHLTNLSNSPENCYHAAISVQPGGEASVVWGEVSPHYDLFLRTFDGRVWSPTQNISADSIKSSLVPQLAFPPGPGKLDLIWVSPESAGAQVMYMGLSPVVSATAEEVTPHLAGAVQTLVSRKFVLHGGRPERLLDAAGRVVTTLMPGSNDRCQLRPGVYFVGAGGRRERIVLIR